MDIDDEGSLLALRLNLDDGSTAPVFTKDGLRYHCNACSVNLTSLSNLKEHLKGKNHSRSMAKVAHPAWKLKDVPAEERKMPILGGMELAPGEPIPPGFEDEVRQAPEILDTLNSMVSPLLGLEFLAEVVGSTSDTEVRYLCMLCDKKGTRSTVMQHLVCFNHRIRYLSRFFPRVYNAFQSVPKVARYRRGTGEVLSKVARAIEKKFGRLEPAVFDEKDFEEKKATLFQSMMDGPHAVETPDCNFESLVNLDEIQKLASKTTETLTIDEETREAKRLSATPKTAFKYGLTRKEEGIRKKVSPPKEPAPKNEKLAGSSWSCSSLSSLSSSSRSPTPTRSRRYSRSPKRSRPYHRSRSPARVWPRTHVRSRSKSRSPLRSYRRRSPYYRKLERRSPPRYSRRSPPPRSTAFRPTISSFKIKATPTLSQKDLDEEHARKLKIRQYEDYAKTVKEEMAQKLKLFEKTPEKHPLYSEEWKKFWNKRYKELIAEGKDAAKHDFKPEWIKYWTEKIKDLHEEEMAKRLNAFRTDLGLPLGNNDDSDDDVVILPQPPPVEREPDPEPEPEPEEDPSLIHVLRLLAALENQLGSFQARVNATFTKALSLEKVEKRSADALLDMPEILVLLEGVKEKLKGQLFTGVIDRHLIKGTKKAIQGLACVLSNHEKKKQEKLKPPEPLIVPGVGFIDKIAIAQQIAATLVEQGRTDLSESDLEQLINAVVGLAQVNSAPAPPPENSQKESNLQSLLSSVVATQSASDSLQMLQNYADKEASAKKANLDSDDFEESPKKLVKSYDERSRNSKSRQVEEDDSKSRPSGQLSPFSLREGGANPVNEDDDDDDYSYEDIFKAAKKNVRKEAKKRLDKEVALQMIDDQKKTSADSAHKPAVLIDPDDLLNGMKSSMAQHTPEIVTPETVGINQPHAGYGYQYHAEPQQNYDYSANSGYSYNSDQNYPVQNDYQQQQWVDPSSYQAPGYNADNGYDYSQGMYNVPPPDMYSGPPPSNFAPAVSNPHSQYQGYY